MQLKPHAQQSISNTFITLLSDLRSSRFLFLKIYVYFEESDHCMHFSIHDIQEQIEVGKTF